MEYEILSTGGKVRIINNGEEKIVPKYPKLLHLKEINKKFYVQRKIDGYNVRIVLVGNEIFTLLRGGMPHEETKKLISKFKEIENFLKKNKDLILCCEIIGKKTMANYKGNEDVKYFVFDIMRYDGSFLTQEEVEKLCKEYKLNYIGNEGIVSNFEELNKIAKKLPGEKEGIEGVVVKSLDGKEIYKYKWKDNEELFKDKIVKRAKQKKEKVEKIIVSHFLQGYEEKELGLNEGISKDEFEKYQEMLNEEIENIEELKRQVNKIVSFLMNCISKKGNFNEELKKKIEKEFRGLVSNKLFKLLKRKGKV